MRRSPAVVLLLAGLLALVSCQGPTASPPAGNPATATPVAPSTDTPAAGPGQLSAWSGCGDGFQCATLTVPLDDAKPSLGTVGIKLTRHRATGSSRRGSLLINPGGPGVSAVDFLKAAYPDLPKPLRSHFDLVAFDPRGVGQTDPVRCETTDALDAFFHLDPAPDTSAELAAFDRGNRAFAQGCRTLSARILPYVSTKIVAQDMDRVRQAVGDEKLTYLGYSYGTAIGAAYLDAFPTHVRAMVLDGALDPALTWDQLLAGQARGFDDALKDFLADCQSTGCAFRKAVTGDLAAAYDRLALSVEATPLPGNGSRTVGPAELSYGVGDALYNKGSWPFLGTALAAAQHGDGSKLLQLSDDYLQRGKDGYANAIEANNAVNCVDRPWPRTDAPALALAKRVAKNYPRFGPAIALSGGVCEFWPVPPASTPHPVSAPGSPAVVVVGTTRDPATPYSWAQSLARQLSQGVLLTHVGDGHTAFHSGQRSCIVGPVDDYLVSLKVPAAATC